MKKRELEKFRKLLLVEREVIVKHLVDLEGASMTQLTQGGGDSVDLASLEISQSSIQKLGNREKKLLTKIDYAIQKINDGDYGTCERCGEEINPLRLEARPVTQYCIDCKTELETNERRYSDSEDEEDESWGEGEKFDDSST